MICYSNENHSSGEAGNVSLWSALHEKPSSWVVTSKMLVTYNQLIFLRATIFIFLDV
jgi:hypothetical protein